MSSIDVNSVLSQIRSLSQQAGLRPAGIPPLATDLAATQATPSQGFGAMVRQGIDGVADSQNAAGKLQQAFELGDLNTDLATVMVASAKAQVSFRAMVEVRNRVVSAYQDVMNMPL
ncbi:flagellar hook-basal body complex protein FliE [Hydrocarboniphaga sp.]|uniref:flagellar hook-basal body complex protein FliE n=1 Tax=Hydrocarboniphaga sp. TaxID=2033016 RepID=UPI0034564BC7